MKVKENLINCNGVHWILAVINIIARTELWKY